MLMDFQLHSFNLFSLILYEQWSFNYYNELLLGHLAPKNEICPQGRHVAGRLKSWLVKFLNGR